MVQIAFAIRQCLVGLLLASPELASLVGVARVEDNAKARAFGQAVRVDHGSQQGCLGPLVLGLHNTWSCPVQDRNNQDIILWNAMNP